MDRWYVERCGVDWLEPALFVATTVVSRPNSDRVIVDAGFKAMSMHDGVPVPVDESAGTLIALFAEHGVLHLARPSLAPKIGERISFIPGYSDSTTVLHSVIIGTRNDRVEAVFPRPPRSPLVSPFPGCSRDRDSARPAAIVDPPGGTIK
ncbi:MAG: hypothetical protein P4L84_36690 [Isosphaeraceae bacterium]|nr:hypothetical protein [Isosphaeraceae bacterium]